MYEIFEKLLKAHGETAYKVAKETGIATATLTQWKNGTSTPKQEKLQKIADHFGVTIDYLMTGKEREGDKYYLNEETARIAQEIFESKELRMLFKTSRDIAPERLKAYHDMMVRMERLEYGEGD